MDLGSELSSFIQGHWRSDSLGLRQLRCVWEVAITMGNALLTGLLFTTETEL